MPKKCSAASTRDASEETEAACDQQHPWCIRERSAERARDDAVRGLPALHGPGRREEGLGRLALGLGGGAARRVEVPVLVDLDPFFQDRLIGVGLELEVHIEVGLRDVSSETRHAQDELAAERQLPGE